MRHHHTFGRTMIIRAILFVLAGAIVNVAVAWGFSLYGSTKWIKAPPASSATISEALLEKLTPRKPPLAHAAMFGRGAWELSGVQPDYTLHHGNGVDERSFSVACRYTSKSLLGQSLLSSSTVGGAFRVIMFRAGWPLRSLQSVERSGIEDAEFGQWKLEHGQAWLAIPNDRRIPFTPIWSGFAINTLFYAAILWLLFAAPGFIRKHRRIKRGLCPVCAYPIGSSEVCTECGEPAMR